MKIIIRLICVTFALASCFINLGSTLICLQGFTMTSDFYGQEATKRTLCGPDSDRCLKIEANVTAFELFTVKLVAEQCASRASCESSSCHDVISRMMRNGEILNEDALSVGNCSSICCQGNACNMATISEIQRLQATRAATVTAVPKPPIKNTTRQSSSSSSEDALLPSVISYTSGAIRSTSSANVSSTTQFATTPTLNAIATTTTVEDGDITRPTKKITLEEKDDKRKHPVILESRVTSPNPNAGSTCTGSNVVILSVLLISVIMILFT